MIAVSLDYVLFLLTRYREEVRRGRENLTAVAIVLMRSGNP